MGWFSILKILAELSIGIVKHMERKGLMAAGAAQANVRSYERSLKRIHNAKEAFDNTPLDHDSLHRDKANRDRH